ncbi:205 kDa microtubule-associated protein [Zeugodacus cucurbitae]|uniref:205 kDa microtubule-associated protein n=1 Tax=Zeugodacus cucurbitae TaxID=28588 RepID=UPI0023D963A0|nr:205 kDa microtubule-associated protein [Zeugodacus cucurbitae]
MEHEDNAHLDNFLQNSQHLMENLQMDRGDGVCDNVAVDEIGGKFEVHEEHDDEEEWKYIKEGQQSEKQQQQQLQQLKAGVACKDVESVEEVGNGHGYGYEHGDVGADDILLLDHHEVGNGVVGISAAVNADADNAATGIVENEEVDVEIIKNDGDFSTTSNTTSTAGEDGYADTGVLQVQMQIQNIPQEEFLPKQVADLLEDCPNTGSHADETEEDDPSSLATNNTNRTNSLSESAPNQELQQLSTEENIIKNEEFSNEDKENTVPSISNVHGDIAFEENTGNSDFDSEMHSQLNPNAIEFVPSFGSIPTSPTTGNSDNQIFVDEEVASNSADEIQLRAQPKSLPRHLLGDDDFVAQSPRKGSAESNLDAIALPEENDFEHEAAKRPHELEQEDDLIGVGTVEHTQQKSQLANDHLQSLNNYAANMLEIERDANEDYSDRLNQSPLNLIDHGPETSVDLEMDLQPLAVEKDDETQEIPKENLEIIEDVFNTVQPLPIDLNTSFVEETSQQEFTAEGKELLDVEEKENISHSPSTEEMQMNLQNEFHSSVKDIPQIPIDMDNAANMQESFYLESTSSEARQQLQEPFAPGIEFSAVDESNFHTNEINAEGDNPVINDPSFDIVQVSAPGTFETEPETALDTSPTSLNIYAPEFTPTPKSIDADIISPSPISTEEKHLIEETKEQANLSETEELEQKMDDLIISSNDGILSQVEEVAQTAANIVESLNPFAASEPEHHETVEETPIEANQVFSTESQPDADISQQNEQSYYNEQQEQQHLQEETAQSTYEHHEDNLLLTKPEDEQPPAASPVQLELELNGFEEHVPAALSVESNIADPVEPESVELSVEPAHEYSHVDLLESPVAQPEHEDIRSELVASPIAEPEHEVPVESPVAEPEHVTVSEPELKDVPQTEVQPVTEPELIAQPEPEVEVLPSEPVIVLDESSNFDANVSAVAEPILESPDQHSSSIPTEANVELAANESTASAVEETVITATAVGALAATAAAVAVAADAHKKTDVKQPRTPTSTKSKAIDVKKAAEPAKKPIGKTSLSTVSAARPRTAPVKTTATADKKPTTTTTTTKSSTTTAARKPLTSTTAASRTVTKTTTTTRPATAPTAAKLTASRTTTTTTARRSAPTTTGASTTATNGTATAKPKPTSGAPTKPTTLGLSGTTKPKLSSPRTTLTSQLRKAPTSTGTGVAAAKSPLKTTAPTANGVTKSSTTTTTAASRAKSSTSTTTTTTTTKTFTARPAPKTTHSSTLTSTTTRRTVGSVSVSATAAKTTSSTLLKKTPPGATRPATTGKSSLSPTKTASSALKAKTKDVTKKAVTPTKSAKDLKHTEEQTKTNGTAVVGAEEPAAIQSEQKPHLNGNGEGDALQLIENGIHKLELENGENPLLEQHIQASLIDA